MRAAHTRSSGALGRLRRITNVVGSTDATQEAAHAQLESVLPTAAEIFLFDMQGFLLLPAVLSQSEVAALRTRLYEL